ncbi:hypothetical protein ACPWT1_00270 [Ramlibacter sp. MMS24-I3-19]|uniref:hypothetical protein n=1 Tax=Ramlibacter sp. MMS24-I3-19 TaxID=3416606 RepID=UPI003D024901
MANTASTLKPEMSALVRKEVRAETSALKRALTALRQQFAEIRQRMESLEREFSKLRKQGAVATPSAEAEREPSLRFRSAGFAKHRQRLGLSAREMGLLLDASPLSVYKWEHGQARPRARHLQAIAATRKISKREAQRRLEELTAKDKPRTQKAAAQTREDPGRGRRAA